jgi:mycothiol synthase
MTELPDGYTLRPPTLADAAAVTAVQVAADVALVGESDASEGDRISDWHAARFDLRHDAWLVQAPDGLVCAYGGVWDDNPHRELFADTAVHPDHRGRGLSELLLDLLEARAREHLAFLAAGEPVSLGVSCWEADSTRRALLESRGYAKTREFRRMVIDVSAGCPQPEWPSGIAVRTFRRGLDEAAVHEADQAAFADHFRPIILSLPEWERDVFSHPELDLDLWFVAWDGQRVAGMVRASELNELGYVDVLGVPRPWRGRGLGRALLLHAFAALRDRGHTTVVLGVDAENPTGAYHLYASVGMRASRTIEFLEKGLRA